MRVVLEMAGVKNGFGKQLGSGNPLNNARATIEGLRAQRTMQMVADERGLSVQQLIGFRAGAGLIFLPQKSLPWAVQGRVARTMKERRRLCLLQVVDTTSVRYPDCFEGCWLHISMRAALLHAALPE